MEKTTKKRVGLKPTQRLSLFFFARPRQIAILWLVITLFGILSYTTLLKREGFPAIQTPFAIAQGSYLVNDPAKVDSDVSKPLDAFLLEQEGIKTVQSQSFANFYTTIASYKDGVDSTVKSQELQTKIAENHVIPEQATLKLEPFKFGFTTRGDNLVVSFFAKDADTSTQQLIEKANKASAFIKSQNLSLVSDVSILNPYEKATNPLTGQEELAQKSFDQFGQRQNANNQFHNSAVIGVLAIEKADNLELDKQVQSAVYKLNANSDFSGYTAVISASFAPQINEQISELQQALLEGLVAILIVGSIVIAIRASWITVLAMTTVIAIVNGILFLIGYSLNTITLFALILGLALIVDDTIIMVEAIDSQRRKQKDPTKAVLVATGKISRAMIAATFTAALSFAPLIFVGGILGDFIRAIPITIITALFVSLAVALIFIPLFARYLLLGKKQMGEGNVKEIAAGLEEKIARFISTPMLWAKNSKKRLVSVILVAIVIGFGFIGAGGQIFQKVTFNIFPPSKDSNQLSVILTFPPDTSIEKAQQVSNNANRVISDVVDDNLVRATYYQNGAANIQQADITIDISGYKTRAITAPEISAKLKDSFKTFEGAKAKVGEISAGGPPSAAFTVQIDTSTDRASSLRLADNVAAHLKQAELKRPDGTIAKIESVAVSNSSIYNRKDGKSYVAVTAKFYDNDTTTLTTLAKASINKEFTETKIASYGIAKDSLSFDLGQEAENQDSFKTLVIAFPALLLVIYIFLAFQFRSLFQPLLIFMAIPFSFFGITLGLYLTDNAFSFFAALGFFALIGLSIKNTILLTDYANQSREAGMDPVDAAHEALAERFRPLIATSLTAVVSLIPLAIMSPFWEGLAVVLIGGLLSSTFLVLTIFPYYYLGAEYLRLRVSRRTALLGTALTIAFAVALSKVSGVAILLAPILAILVIQVFKRTKATKTS